ncbi:Na+/H+ antiporter subunit C [Motiliproteus coralliicola]|uniref:Na+/H+ antiporter subunit C n=1 Tax=Motiliproteus coralliicola TaxID=2283196 RepID=A0A369WR98_9GAMM|nr:NADH-quinone oxidoreductase subunit K [Motiliproteus coralliicola]RDE24061.1 Na+/H+ antiporter subunit C [Motiliproteus coralliicola]
MGSSPLLYAVTGALIFGIGLLASLRDEALLARIIAINISGVGVFLMLVSFAYRGFELAPDPIPHALVLTGIVVAVAASGLALALEKRLAELPKSKTHKEDSP